MKRVLVTGAAGFIGWQCLPLLLAAGYEVHGLAKHLPDCAPAGVVWHQADLFDEAAVTAIVAIVRPTHLLHLAWYATPGKYWMALENFACVRASLALGETFTAHGGERLVGAGSCAEYDARYGYCSEALTPTAPTTIYSACKDSLRGLLEALAARTGISNAWGRIFLLYGPRENPQRLVSSVALALLRGHSAPCSHGRQLRDFSHVEDIAGAFVALLDSDVTGPVNIASGTPVRVSEIIYTLADQVGRRDLVQLGALPDQPNEPRALLADTTRLEEEVGWVPKYDREHGLAHTLAWWKEHEELYEVHG